MLRPDMQGREASRPTQHAQQRVCALARLARVHEKDLRAATGNRRLIKA